GVDLSAIPDDPDQVTVEQSEQLAHVLSTLPAAALDVIVPLTALIGAHPPGTDADGIPVPAAFTAQPGHTGEPGGTGGPGGPGCTCTCSCGANRRTSADPPDLGRRGQPCPDRTAHY